MIFKKKYVSETHKGFTLIELLVVVGIIAVISSVLFTFMGSSKKKGDDGAVKANLNTIRGLAGIFFNNNNLSFLPSGGTALAGTCPASYSASATNMFRDQNIYMALVEAAKRGSGYACYNSIDAWAVAVGLKTTANTSWCVDSTGKSKLEAFTPANAIDGTSYACK